MGLFPLKTFSWRPYIGSLHHVNIHLSCSALKTNEESTPSFTQYQHGCLAASNGLLANDFLYLLSETIRNAVLTKFVCCADSDLLFISKLRTYIITWHRIPTSHNANPAVRNIALLHNTPLRGALGVDHVFTKHVSIWYFIQIILSKMSQLNLYSFARKLRPSISFRLHLSWCCPH